MNDYDKVIFLDVDGVLNDMEEDNFEFEWDTPTDKHLKVLADIVHATNAWVVVTSSWRLYRHPLDLLVERLDDWGMDVEDITPDLLNEGRADEIKAWLAEHSNVKHFVILDDEVIVDDELVKHQVKTSIQKGLLPMHVEQAVSILQK